MLLGYPNHPRKDPIEEILWIAKNGFDFIDLFLEPDVCDVNSIDTAKIRKALSDNGLQSVGHTAWYIPIGSAMRELREAAVSISAKYLSAFAEIGCKNITFHANWPSGMFTAEDGLKYQIESLTRICDTAKKLGVVAMFEPVGMLQETAENLSKIFRSIPNLKFHLDIGHFNLNHRDPGEFAEIFREKLGHIHLHDNDGQRDLHLPPGTGNIDWDKLIKRIKKIYDGTITLEIFSNDRDYTLLAKKKFVEKWNAA